MKKVSERGNRRGGEALHAGGVRVGGKEWWGWCAGVQGWAGSSGATACVDGVGGGRWHGVLASSGSGEVPFAACWEL